MRVAPTIIVIIAFACSACRRGTGADSALADAASDAAEARWPCADGPLGHQGGACPDAVENEADLDVSFMTNPPLTGTGDDVELRFTVETQKLNTDFPGGRTWGYNISGSQGSTSILVGFDSYKPWLLANQLGEVWQLSSSSVLTGCADAFGEANARSELIVRDGGGQLRFAEVLTPLWAGGKLDLVAGWTPEFSVTWGDSDCPSVAGTHNGYDRPFKDVVLRLQPQGGSAVEVGAGDRATVQFGGATYYVTVGLAAKYLDADCGDASFVVYRRGFLCQVAPDGGMP